MAWKNTQTERKQKETIKVM